MIRDVTKKSSKRTFALAGILIIVFVVCIFLLDLGIHFVVSTYFPALYKYVPYLDTGTRAILAIVGAYLVYKVLMSIIAIHWSTKIDSSSGEVVKIIVRVGFYFIAVSIILASAGISLTTALAGGAVGGIVIGLAIQTVLTSILSGFLISSSKTILPGEVLYIQTASLGNFICKVIKVGTVFTEVTNNNGIMMKIPNNVLFSSSAFSRLRTEREFYTYSFQASINTDVPMKKFEKRVKDLISVKFKKMKEKMPEVYLISKTSGANIYNIKLKFDRFEEINALVSDINNALDDAYWACK